MKRNKQYAVSLFFVLTVLCKAKEGGKYKHVDQKPIRLC